MPKKRVKYTRMYLGGLPKTRKKRDRVYRFLEATGTMRMLFSSSEIIVNEKVKD